MRRKDVTQDQRLSKRNNRIPWLKAGHPTTHSHMFQPSHVTPKSNPHRVNPLVSTYQQDYPQAILPQHDAHLSSSHANLPMQLGH